MKKEVSIIGAGIGGLSAAIELQHSGYDVTIFEKNHQVGGKMNRLEVDGFKFDMGPTIVMMPDIYKKPFIDTGVNPDDYFTMERIDPFMDVKINDKQYVLSSDLVAITQQFENADGIDMLGFLNYLSDIYGKYLNAKDNFIYQSYRSFKDFFNVKTLINSFKLKTFSSSFNDMKKFIPNQELQYLLSFQTLYIGISPFSGPSIYNIIPMIELLYGIWYIKGGMYEYALALKKRFEELGGCIQLDSEVSRIETRNRTATGITIDGVSFPADAVVVNADFPYTVENLIPQNNQKTYPKKRVNQKLKYSMSCLLLYLGTDQKYPNLNLHTIKMASDFENNVNEIENGKLPKDASYYIYNPSLIDDSFAPQDSSSLYLLVPFANLQSKQWSEAEYYQYADKIIAKFQKDFAIEDFQNHIQVKKIFTPNNFASLYNSKFGTAFGLKPTLLQSNYFRPHNKFKDLNNLYFAGASTHPGAGVPIVITSGKLAANELKKDFKLNE